MVQQESVIDDSDTHSRRFISTTKPVVGEITNSSVETTATVLRHEYNVPFTMMYLIQVLNRHNPA